MSLTHKRKRTPSSYSTPPSPKSKRCKSDSNSIINGLTREEIRNYLKKCHQNRDKYVQLLCDIRRDFAEGKRHRVNAETGETLRGKPQNALKAGKYRQSISQWNTLFDNDFTWQRKVKGGHYKTEHALTGAVIEYKLHGGMSMEPGSVEDQDANLQNHLNLVGNLFFGGNWEAPNWDASVDRYEQWVALGKPSTWDAYLDLIREKRSRAKSV